MIGNEMRYVTTYSLLILGTVQGMFFSCAGLGMLTLCFLLAAGRLNCQPSGEVHFPKGQAAEQIRDGLHELLPPAICLPP